MSSDTDKGKLEIRLKAHRKRISKGREGMSTDNETRLRRAPYEAIEPKD